MQPRTQPPDQDLAQWRSELPARFTDAVAAHAAECAARLSAGRAMANEAAEDEGTR